ATAHSQVIGSSHPGNPRATDNNARPLIQSHVSLSALCLNLTVTAVLIAITAVTVEATVLQSLKSFARHLEMVQIARHVGVGEDGPRLVAHLAPVIAAG